MSIELPLWDKKTKDVIPEFQLTFGHVIFEQKDSAMVTRAIEREIRYGVIASSRFDGERIPRSREHGQYVLQEGNRIHIILAKTDVSLCVFAPHRFFFQNQLWIRCNKTVGGLMIIAVQGDRDEVDYRVFRGGEFAFIAANLKGSMRIPEQKPIELYLDDKKIHEEKMADLECLEEAKHLLANDLALRVGKNGIVGVTSVVAGASPRIDTVEHLILEPRTASGLGRFLERLM